MRFLVCLLSLSLIPLCTFADQPPEDASREELEKWFESDAPDDAEEVNGGQLTFLTQAPADKVLHHHQNKVRITADSLTDGWTQLEQCHDNLDAVAALQITFRDGYVKDMRVTEQRNIGKAWVEGASVQLKDVGKQAHLCLQARTRALRIQDDGSFALMNGPYMRKFLDGYYPMRVSMQVEYPPDLLKVAVITPTVQPGFAIRQQDGELDFDAMFEGELRTAIQFEMR